MKRRARGTGTVAEHDGVLRLRMPENLDPKRTWMKRTFALDEAAIAHKYMDDCVRHGRAILDKRNRAVSMAVLWPRFSSRECSNVERRRGMHAAHKRRSHLDGIERGWLSDAPFWNKELSLVRGQEITDWLEEVRTTGKNDRGGLISDSWVDQLARAIRGVFGFAGIDAPDFEVKTEKRGKRSVSALTLHQQKRLFRVIEDEMDRIMAGCQMGAGLRKGEILSLRAMNVVLGTEPHIMVETGGAHAAPTKSLKPRRVELVEPGLGFFIKAMKAYRDNPKGLLFCGPSGGYLKHWPDKFVAWSEAMGMRVTSHMMRHTYAYSMLSGSWGYEPQGVTFVSRQFGHADTKTTEDYYGHWDPGAGLATARVLRGETPKVGRIITANWLLGEAEGSRLEPGRTSPRIVDQTANWVSDGSSANLGSFPGGMGAPGRNVDVHAAALALTQAVLRGETAEGEAVHFLKCLRQTPEALRAMAMILEGDARGRMQAIVLAGQVGASRKEGAA